MGRTLGRITVAKNTTKSSPPNTSPIGTNACRAGSLQRKLEKEKVNQMLKSGVAKPVVQKWASLIVFVSEKGGCLMFCIDYCRLKAVIKIDSYSLIHMHMSIEFTREEKLFSTLEASSGYWWINVDENDTSKTAFASYHGLYKHIENPFGNKNASPPSQRAMNFILATLMF